MDKDEALKLALEALSSGEKMKADGIGWWEYDSRLVKQAITAAKEALAQPAQEPVARCCYHDSDCAVHNMPAYPAGPCDCTQEFKFYSVTGKFERQAFASLSGAEAYCKGLNATYPEGNYIIRPLIDKPAQRPWIGLTDELIEATVKKEMAHEWATMKTFAQAIEQALKEKNT